MTPHDPSLPLARQILKTARIIHAALMASVLLYAVPLATVCAQSTTGAIPGAIPGATPPLDPTVRLAILGGANLFAVTLIALGTLRVRAASVIATDAANFQRLAMPARILRLAGAEGIALGGFVVALLTHQTAVYFLPAAIALGAMAAMFPRSIDPQQRFGEPRQL